MYRWNHKSLKSISKNIHEIKKEEREKNYKWNTNLKQNWKLKLNCMDEHSIKVSFIVKKCDIRVTFWFHCAFASIHLLEVNSIDKSFQVNNDSIKYNVSQFTWKATYNLVLKMTFKTIFIFLCNTNTSQHQACQK